jgi:hypothetical protein
LIFATEATRIKVYLPYHAQLTDYINNTTNKSPEFNKKRIGELPIDKLLALFLKAIE